MASEQILATAALAVAVLAVFVARRLARRLDRLADSYWELRYEHGQLRARLTRLEGGEPEAAPPPAGPSSGSFIPLSSVKR